MAWALVTEGDRHKPRFLYFLAADWDGMSGSSWDHGTFAGLLDDDHTQYVLVDGSRSMTGTLTIENSAPQINFIDTDYSTGYFVIKSDGAVFDFAYYNTGSSSWDSSYFQFDQNASRFYLYNTDLHIRRDRPAIYLTELDNYSNYWNIYVDWGGYFNIDYTNVVTSSWVPTFSLVQGIMTTYVEQHNMSVSLGTQYANIQLGLNRTDSGGSYIDLIGDTTYTDYGLRVIRWNTGANTTSQIDHRGTGYFYITCNEAAELYLGGNASTRVVVGSTPLRIADDPAVLQLYDNTTADTYQHYTYATAYTLGIKDGPTSSWTYLIGFGDSGILRTVATAPLKETCTDYSSSYIVTQKACVNYADKDYGSGHQQLDYNAMGTSSSYVVFSNTDAHGVTNYDEMYVLLYNVGLDTSTDTLIMQFQQGTSWITTGWDMMSVIWGVGGHNVATGFECMIYSYVDTSYRWTGKIHMSRLSPTGTLWLVDGWFYKQTLAIGSISLGKFTYASTDINGIRFVTRLGGKILTNSYCYAYAGGGRNGVY